MENHAVDDAKNRNGGSDAQRQGEDRSQSESWILDQLPEGVTNVRSNAADQKSCIHGSDAFLRHGAAAKAHQRITPGLLRRHAGSKIVFRAQCDVGLKFGIDVAVDPRAVQQISHTAENGHRAPSHA